MIQQEGSGWRLARDSSRKKFPYLIGGPNWAIELTEDEWYSLFSIINELISHHAQLINKLVPEEIICIEKEKTPWWACLEGDSTSWSLKVVLNGEVNGLRGAEGFWPIPTAQAFAFAMRTIWDSSH